MGRKRKNVNLLKTTRSIRLPNWIWVELEKRGRITNVIEEILTKYLKDKEKDEKDT